MWGATNGDDLGESKAVARAITTQWYNGELNAYSPNFYGNEPDMGRFSVWGHFSQLVWVDTEELGCAVHYCPKGTMNDDVGVWYSVCNYFPAGKSCRLAPSLNEDTDKRSRQHGWCLLQERPAPRQRQRCHCLSVVS